MSALLAALAFVTLTLKTALEWRCADQLAAKSLKAGWLRIPGGLEFPSTGRALAIEPRMRLLDEPFDALDAKVRRELRQGLRDIHDTTGLTTIFVTHDQEEAMELADLGAVTPTGRIEQVGPPQNPLRAGIHLGLSARLAGFMPHARGCLFVGAGLTDTAGVPNSVKRTGPLWRWISIVMSDRIECAR